MPAARHPIKTAALNEKFKGCASWRALPSWTLIATSDRSISTQAQIFMAERAGSVITEIDSSHAVPVAHPVQTSAVILAASFRSPL
jgi:hypothetical protein